ncbi:DNA repair protein RecO [Shewanella maritima]|uniref:DNA repair protein RecO n=1 Tax=Shewanella maritima TaxID=2520507 RepID=UPI0037351637
MQRAYVIHHRPFRESSVIVNLLVDGQGRVDAITRVGKGKRSIKSILQPFQPLLIQFSYQPKNREQGLQSIQTIEPASPPMPLQGHSLYSGMYMNELLVRLISVEHQASTLFVAYHQALMSLATEFNANSLRYFEMALLNELGAMPELLHDTQEQAIESGSHYRYLFEQGFMPVFQAEHQAKPIRNVYSGDMLLALQQQQLTLAQTQAAKGLMRILLTPLLGDKPLLSRKLFQT